MVNELNEILMLMSFLNVYEDSKRADSYAKLEFPGTYYLAYRDLPEIISRYVKRQKALDFGCGTGRSTRFLYKLGFDVIGVDIAEEMIARAKKIDPKGKYCLVEENSLEGVEGASFDLILSVFTFDNIPGEKKVMILSNLRDLLNEEGKIVSLV